MRVTTNPVPVTGDAVPFDPDNPGPFAAAAGEWFLRTEGRTAVVRDQSGNEDVIYPGWLVIWADGGTVPHFTNAANLGEGDTFFWNPA